MVLIDTTVLIEYFRSQNKTKTFFYALAGKNEAIYVSAITKFEIWVGNRPDQHEFWENLFATLKTIPFGELEAEKAGEIQQTLIKSNRQMKKIGAESIVIIVCFWSWSKGQYRRKIKKPHLKAQIIKLLRRSPLLGSGASQRPPTPNTKNETPKTIHLRTPLSPGNSPLSYGFRPGYPENCH